MDAWKRDKVLREGSTCGRSLFRRLSQQLLFSIQGCWTWFCTLYLHRCGLISKSAMYLCVCVGSHLYACACGPCAESRVAMFLFSCGISSHQPPVCLRVRACVCMDVCVFVHLRACMFGFLSQRLLQQLFCLLTQRMTPSRRILFYLHAE